MVIYCWKNKTQMLLFVRDVDVEHDFQRLRCGSGTFVEH